MRVAVTGAGGRLGRALAAALADAPFTGLTGPLAWRRPDFDLDRPDAFVDLFERDRPEVIVHAAAWTDVDGCARDPALAMHRNGEATGRLARLAADRDVDLLVISTNEVFDGQRSPAQGYSADDDPRPINPYGGSKLAGEQAALAAYASTDLIGRARRRYEPHATEPGFGAMPGPQLAILRTSWLYGPPGNDFPAKILAAADRARSAGERMKVVGDEVGSPTYVRDLGDAVVELLGAGLFAGIHHLVNAGVTSRAGWARELLRQARVEVGIDEVPSSTWPRASTPPLNGILEPTPLPSGEPMRAWPDALADYLPALLRQQATVAR